MAGGKQLATERGVNAAPEIVGYNKVVSLLYVLRTEDGKEVDRSGDEPLEYLHGHGGIVPGLEVALEGKAVGSKLNTVVSPEDGYGELEQNSTKSFERRHFPKDVEVGMQFVVEGSDGNPYPVWVRQVAKDRVVVDKNHPLAGKALHFSVEVVAIRDASPEEIAHGHAHGSHDHHHDHDHDHDHHHHH